MIVDIHVHLVGMREDNGCFVHPRMAGGLTFGIGKRLLGFTGIPTEELDLAYRTRLVEQAEASDLDGVGLLALDGVYDDRGELDRERTNVLVGNDYCFEVCRVSRKLHPICSVNPQRKDALDELERVHEEGAVALKAVPNSQGFDPAEPRYKPFWQRMADLGMPLLSHGSFEHTVPVYDQSYGKPQRLRPALDCGVTVIVAHCASAGVLHLGEDIHAWFGMLEEYPNLYGDLSAMVSLARFPYLPRILARDLARQRVMLGSDYPVPVTPALLLPRLGPAKVWELHRVANPLQRNLLTLRAMGVDDAVLGRAAEVLRLGRDGGPGAESGAMG